MSKDTKKTLAFLFFLLAGILVGSAVAFFTKDIFFLSWLSYGINFGIPSSTLDLYVFRLTAGVELERSSLVKSKSSKDNTSSTSAT